jgi:Flp pilus assembly pilin Flp
MAQLVSTIRTCIAALQGEEGQGLVEYSLILLLVAVVAFFALTFLGVQITSFLSSAAVAL